MCVSGRMCPGTHNEIVIKYNNCYLHRYSGIVCIAVLWICLNLVCIDILGRLLFYWI